MIPVKNYGADACRKTAKIGPVVMNRMKESSRDKSGAGSNRDVLIDRQARNGRLTVSIGQDKIVVSYGVDILSAGAVKIYGVGHR